MGGPVKRVPAAHTQQRGRDRREQLLRAALEVLAEGGMKAVTHRAVAARAGLPLASTTYYFDSIVQLTEEALLLGVEERIARLRPFASATRSPGQSVPDLATEFISAVMTRPPADIVAQLEVYLEAARNPALRDAASAAIGSFEDVAASALAVVSDRDPGSAAIALSALIDGFALHRLARPLEPGQEFDALFRALRALFITHVATEEELAAWTERLRSRVPVDRSAPPDESPSSVTPHG